MHVYLAISFRESALNKRQYCLLQQEVWSQPPTSSESHQHPGSVAIYILDPVLPYVTVHPEHWLNPTAYRISPPPPPLHHPQTLSTPPHPSFHFLEVIFPAHRAPSCQDCSINILGSWSGFSRIQKARLLVASVSNHRSIYKQMILGLLVLANHM